MNKYFEEWDGKKFPVREIKLPEELGGFTTNVTTIELWDSIEEAYEKGDSKAHRIDNDIYYYFDSGFIASDPTDEEIIEYLIKHKC